MYQSRGFSFIEVILVLSLSSIIILVFIQSLSFSRKLLNQNLQSLFYERPDNFVSRGLQATTDFLLTDLPDSIGKRNCSINNLENFQNIKTPQYQNHGEVVFLNLTGSILLVGLNSATSSDPDVLAIDTNSWNVLSSLNTGPGVAGAVLQGHYLFLANTSVNSQFQVVDVSNPAGLILVGSFKIPGTSSKHNPIITSITSNTTNYGNARIFLGSQKSDIGEIFVADFNGSGFLFITSYDTGSIVNDIFADGSGLWVTSPSDDELFHYNASGTKDYVFNANGQSGNGKRIDILGQNLKMLGRTFGHEELVQVNGPSQKIGGTINDLLINIESTGKINILILANVGGSSLFQVWNTKNGMLDKLLKSVVLPAPANRIACGEDTIYIGTSSSSVPFITFKL